MRFWIWVWFADAELADGLRDRLDVGGLEEAVDLEAVVGDREGVGDLAGSVGDDGTWIVEVGLLILRASEAGGPTGTMREPNSTPIVTS